MTCAANVSPSVLSSENGGASAAKQPVDIKPPRSPAGRNTFTVCHVSQHPDAAVAREFLDEHLPPARADMSFQRTVVHEYRQARLHEATSRCDVSGALGEEERVIALKCLVRLAAERALSLARAADTLPLPLPVVRRTWQTLLRQVEEYLRGAEGGEESAPLDRRCRGALENISALGVWFPGDASIPFRRYSMGLVTADGTLQQVVAVGLVSFVYSSYVMDDRRRAQQATLAELERLSKGLGVDVRFLPTLVVPEGPPQKDDCRPPTL